MKQQEPWPPQAQRWFDGQELLMDKPLGWTSFDLVNKVRIGLRNTYGIRKIKVGHAGTLDPLATGLMILLTGRFTKKVEAYQGLDKEYIARIHLGATTPSFDLETTVDETFPYEHIDATQVRQVLLGMSGAQMQTPPLYSAKKIKGRRAYDFAREGETTEIRQQSIHIHEFELLDFALPEIRVRIACSKGTYIRALARDIGQNLGSGAHLTGLVRTRIGTWSLEQAHPVEDLEKILNPM